MSFSELLKEEGSVTIHYRNVQKFGKEIYNVNNNHCPVLMHEILPDRNYKCSAHTFTNRFGISTCK